MNPVSGPVFVKDTRPGDVLQVDLLEFRPRGFGWTAIESGLDVVLRLSVRRDFAVDAPQFAVPAVREMPGAHHVCTGVGPDLYEAARDATRAAIAHLGERRGLDREEAYAVVRVACDLRIHEIVDVPNRVVGCFIPDAIFASRRSRTRSSA